MAALRAINNARVVAPVGLLESASVVLEGGRIAGVSRRSDLSGCETLDAGGRYVLPGLVDLHTDAIEKQGSPRPGARFTVEFAFSELDRLFAGSGITTAFHGVSFMEWKGRSIEQARDFFSAVVRLREEALVRHELHLRCELPQEASVEAVVKLLPTRVAKLVSLTDHTPGQGQYRDLEAFRRNRKEVLGEDESVIEAQIALATRKGAGASLGRVEWLARAVKESGAVLASHDDDTPEKVRFVVERGARISEFPIDAESAREAKMLGVAVAVGAPNAVLGRSTTGNLSAEEAVRLGLADALVSDYHPPSMLQAVFKLAREGVLPLHEAAKLVSSGPARAVDLDDRGEIREGALADLIVVGERFGLPAVTHTIVGGEVVLASGGKANQHSKKDAAGASR